MRLLIPLFLILAFPVSAQVYKWTDENGITHFGNQPPPGQKEEVRIRDSQPGSMSADSAAESDIIRQSRELERRKSEESIRRAEQRYRERVAEIEEEYEERPDYICQGASNRLKSARDRWKSKKRQGYSIDDERYYEQLIKDRQRHRDNVCR
ncbi:MULTISPECIES: DUF4124 domain-containing protein [Marinobacter]|uniref:DUF4124 domain-containing protein n=1 Tax=Marinobacter TaxID=2742 RepID=UPI0029436F1E|nr:DUF4124 domain-containing protein [Marinobacter salarius]WOI18119.1 DUF4124 domain-containing protein [Marinobacter salarius]